MRLEVPRTVHTPCWPIALLAALTAAACGGSSPPQAESVAEILDEPSVCSTAALSGACRGPWAYHPYVTPCYVLSTDPACPNTVPGQCHPSCQHAELGFSVSKTVRIGCVGSGCAGSGQDPESKCTQQTNTYENQTAGNLTNVIPSHTITNLSRVEHSQYDANCNMTLQNVRIGVDDACLPTFACNLPGACRLPSHGNAPPGECGTSTAAWLATASGLGFGSLTAEQHAGLYADSCSTLEDHPVNAARLDLTVSRTSTADPFWSVVPVPGSQAVAARHDLVKQAKLMFELGIAPTDRNAVRALYDSAPGDELACGVSAAAPVSAGCASFGTTNHLDGPLGLCQRMLSTHVAAAVFQAELDGCLDLLSRPELAGTSACAVEYRNLAETVAEHLLTKGLAAVQMPAGSTTIAGLGPALARIDRWYAGAALAFATDPAALSDGTGRVLAGFWSQAYAASSPVPSFALGEAGSSTARTQLASLFASRIDTDRQVLAAAFDDPSPLDEAPLLQVVSDGLSAIRERLITAAPFYDLACRFKGSCGLADANEATLLLRLLGAIGDDAALGDALAAATGVVRAPWRDLFVALRTRRSVLEAAYRKATGRTTATLAELYQSGVIGPAAALADEVSSSFAMWTSYASHGVLQPTDGRLRTSLTGANVIGALTTFAQRRGTLTAHRTDYQRTRGDFAQTVLNRINNTQFQDRVNDEAAVLRVDYDNLGSDLDGLMAAQDHAEDQIGKFLATYIARASGPGWLPQFPVQGHPGLLAINATAARGDRSFVTDVTTVAVIDPAQPGQPWRLDVGKGDMLTFDITGSWSPTCALRKTTLVGPNGSSVFSDPAHLQVGTEGFSVSWQTDHFEAKDHVSSDFSSVTQTTSVCGSVSANLLTAVSGPVPVGSIAVSAQTCQQWQTGHSDTDSTTDGSRFQYTANFAGGLRVATTPFPTLPAGALLLVEVVPAAGGGTRMRDVHVVRPHASLVFPEQATVYLVANDERDPTGCAAVDTSPLTINYVHGQSPDGAARGLAETMATVLASLETSRATYTAQGSVTATELSSLQTAAYDQLRASCGGCNLSAFPDEVRGMFDAWLSIELAAIERATRVITAERGLADLVLRLKAMQDDLAGAASSSRLLALMTYWQLGHLAYHLEDPDPALRTSAELLLESASDALALMNILYPQALTTLRQAATPINALRTLDWTLPYDEQAFALENFTEVVQARIEDARSAGGLSIAPVPVVFPKPGIPAPAIPASVIVAPERAAAVWEPCGTSICLRRKPTFTLAPEDIYGRPLVGLGCLEAAPVVQSFAVIAVNSGSSSNEDWNRNPRRADIFRGADMLFPAEAGVLDYRTDGPGALLAPSRVRILASDETGVGDVFTTSVRQPGGDLQGVSPFNSFTIDLGPAVTDATLPLKSATAMVVYFDLQTRSATGALSGVGTCSQPPAGSTPPPPPPPPGDGGPDGSPPAGGGPGVRSGGCPVSAGGTASAVCQPGGPL